MLTGLTISGIRGHTDAYGDLTLVDESSENADLLEFGLQHPFDPDDPEPLQIAGEDLVLTGYAGSLDTEAGSDSTNVVAATLSGTPVVVCSTGPQPHVGRWRPGVRVLGSDGGVRVRLGWRVGDGPVSTAPWVEVPWPSTWFELDLDVITIREVPSGTHSWEGFIEAKAATPGTTFAIDFLGMMPAYRWGRARAPVSFATPTALLARDEFDQTSGNLSGKTPPLGAGDWVEESVGGGSGNFTIDATNHRVQRTAVSDSAAAWRMGYVDDATYDDLALRADFRFSALATSGGSANGGGQGIGKRIDSSNFIVAGLAIYDNNPANCRFVLSQGLTHPAEVPMFMAPGTDYSIAVQFRADGLVTAWIGPRGAPIGEPQLRVRHDDFASGGTHGDGYPAILDIWREATANTRVIDNFAAWPAETAHVLYADESITFRHNTCENESADGSRSGRVPVFEGQHLRIPPATRAGLQSRLVVKRRRFDTAGGYPSDGLDDDLSASLTATPRVLLLAGA